jgi:hypothetical protein
MQMATWSDLVGYVRANYRVAEEKPNMLQMVFDTGNLRSQLVFLWRQTLMGGEEEWVQIESPFAKVGSVDLQRALEEVGGVVCGGAAIDSGHLLIRHAVPLGNLNINEFERPLHLVTTTADHLERELDGSDRY